jgi:SAM-dependent methyltransferase
MLAAVAAGAAVVGVEPHAPLVAAARARVTARRLPRTTVRSGSATSLGVPDASVGLVFSHWAYFFGPGAAPGVRAVQQALRPGGIHLVVDVDRADCGPGYARWLAATPGTPSVAAVEAFWEQAGYTRRTLPVVWAFPDRDTMAAVLAIEFPPGIARAAAADTVGTVLRVPTVVRAWRRMGSEPSPTVGSWP